MAVADKQVHELMYQMLETELGGQQVYEAALRCARNDDLREEWRRYHDQTTHHVELVRGVLDAFGLDPDALTPGRKVVRHTGESLRTAIEMAEREAAPEEAQVVAAECVTLAETKDHLNWELVGELVGHLTGEPAEVLRSAYEEIEGEEDEHLYHTRGWARELWIEGLGMPAVLPPPEEQKHVTTAIGAARAEKAREKMA